MEKQQAQAECDWRQANSNFPCTPPFDGKDHVPEEWCPVAMSGACPSKES